MDSRSAGAEPGFDSELIDLGMVPLTVLREMGGAGFQQRLRRVLQHAAHPRVSVGGSSGGERID